MSIRNDLAWMQDALCAKVRIDPDLFAPTSRKEVPEEIRELCGRCPVRVECDAYGTQNKDRQTIRAGMSLVHRSHRSAVLKYQCGHCGVRTRRKSKICPGCAPDHKRATTMGGTRK